MPEIILQGMLDGEEIREVCWREERGEMK